MSQTIEVIINHRGGKLVSAFYHNILCFLQRLSTEVRSKLTDIFVTVYAESDKKKAMHVFGEVLLYLSVIPSLKPCVEEATPQGTKIQFCVMKKKTKPKRNI